ncbi:MAG TPA: sulfatase-like hydrolase/transferase [Chloroflexota bacterium]|nr:sulfatase-like hydrolase/transferase [Chloroflexota bacterium]
MPVRPELVEGPAGTSASAEQAAPPNILIIFSDEHDGALLGAAGHPQVRTPHLDRLAVSPGGTLFERAYCAGPVCVPSRLSLLTGKYPHQVGGWDNGATLDSAIRTWGHYLRAAGYETTIIGRTHFNGADRLHGFDRRELDDLPFWLSTAGAGPARAPETRRRRPHVAGVSVSEDEPDPLARRHDTYDAEVAERAVRFLSEREDRSEPWLLYCGMIHPHFPLTAPRDVLAEYDPAAVTLPPTWDEPPERQHPVVRQLRHALGNDVPLTEEQVRRAIAAYWALVTLVDRRIGVILDALEASPLRGKTAVLYTSDHGDMAGHHGMWQKHCFYEPSVRVPLLLRLPPGLSCALPPRVRENVSLVDVLPTLLDLAGMPVPSDLPGYSLLSPQSDRVVFSEMHEGMLDAGFMVKRGPYKYVHYLGGPPQLFDTHADPLEVQDLAADPAHAALRAGLESALRRIADPETVDAAAKADQGARRSTAA